MKAPALGAHVSLVAGLDGSAEPQPEHDESCPVADPHESHDWVLYHRWSECSCCGVRDYWPGAEALCAPLPRGKARRRQPPPVSLDEALARLALDLERFGEWWREHHHEGERPTLAEWTAEFLEFTRSPGGRL